MAKPEDDLDPRWQKLDWYVYMTYTHAAALGPTSKPTHLQVFELCTDFALTA